MDTTTNAPGQSDIYAVARRLLDVAAPCVPPSTASVGAWVGTCHAGLTRYGGDWALQLDDVHRIERSTLDTWAAAVGQDAAGWRIDQSVGGRVARLEWATDGAPMPAGPAVMWIGGNHGCEHCHFVGHGHV